MSGRGGFEQMAALLNINHCYNLTCGKLTDVLKCRGMKRHLALPKYRMLRPPQGLHRKLLRWYDQAKRDMPWRDTRDA